MLTALLLEFRVAWMNLVQHRRRSLLLGGAIAVVTAMVVLLVALSTGIARTLVDSATTLATGHLNVGGFLKPTTIRASAAVSGYREVAKIVEQALPELEFWVSRTRGVGTVVSERSSRSVAVNGIDIASEPLFRETVRLVKGRVDELAQPKTMLLFEKHARELEVDVGDVVTISTETVRGVANTVDCRVVAVAADMGLLSQMGVFIPGDTARALYQLGPDVTGAIQIHVGQRHLKDVDAFARRLREALDRAHYRMMEPDPQSFWAKLDPVQRENWSGQKLDVTTWEDEVSFMKWSIQTSRTLGVVLGAILLGIVVVGVSNTLWIAVRERTREIGTLRAIGAQRASVARLFLLEAALLGLCSAACGVGLGLSASALLNVAHIPVPLPAQLFLMNDTLKLTVELRELCWVVALLTCITGAAAVLPSLRAARLGPADAMAHFK
jgi:ABC-type lipoprotein release transport system permease subunit